MPLPIHLDPTVPPADPPGDLQLLADQEELYLAMLDSPDSPDPTLEDPEGHLDWLFQVELRDEERNLFVINSVIQGSSNRIPMGFGLANFVAQPFFPNFCSFFRLCQ